MGDAQNKGLTRRTQTLNGGRQAVTFAGTTAVGKDDD